MQRISELMGKAVVTADGGEKVGTVSDVLLDERQLLAVVVNAGWFSGERMLPFDAMQAIGRDAIVARAKDHVADARQWRERGTPGMRSSSLKDKRVVTKDGRQIGVVKDVYVDERSGLIDGYDVAGRGFGGLVTRHSMLPRSGDVTVGPDVIVVSGEAADQLGAGADGTTGTPE